jgi:hypothetical protein
MASGDFFDGVIAALLAHLICAGIVFLLAILYVALEDYQGRRIDKQLRAHMREIHHDDGTVTYIEPELYDEIMRMRNDKP